MFHLHDLFRNWWLILLALILGPLLGGCASQKAVDSTRALEALARVGEVPNGSQASTIPTDRGTLVLPQISAMKDTKAHYIKRPDGSEELTWEATMAPSIDAAFGAIAGIDAGKFQQDRWIMEQAADNAREWRDFAMGVVVPLINQPRDEGPDELNQTQLLLQDLRQLLFEAAQARNGQTPATAPSAPPNSPGG